MEEEKEKEIEIPSRKKRQGTNSKKVPNFILTLKSILDVQSKLNKESAIQ